MADMAGKPSDEGVDHGEPVLPHMKRRISRVGSQNFVNFSSRTSSLSNVAEIAETRAPVVHAPLQRRISRVAMDTGVTFPPIARRMSIVQNKGLYRRPSIAGFFPTVSQPKLQTIDDEPSYFDETPEKLPKTPRFCATMSTEAQYAMLKGYEDVLFYQLSEEYPDSSMLRTKTPANSDVVARLKSAQLQQQARDNDTKVQLDKKQNLERVKTEHTRDSLKTRDAGRRIVSYRFQNAMDILDTMKAARGQMVTSSLEKKPRIHPLKGYNYWSKIWSKDIKFERRHHRAHKSH